MAADLPFGSPGRGFRDPVMDAQRCFRRILAAMAEPGTVHALDADIDAPPGLAPAAAILLLVLADHETPLWLEPGHAAAAPFLCFHTGARLAELPVRARFAVVDASASVPLTAFDQGDERYPDRSATVIVHCPSLTGGAAVELAGPGIRGRRPVAPLGVDAHFWSEFGANGARYPLGVDLVLVAGHRIMCLPRSTRVVDAHGGEHAKGHRCTLP